MAAKKDEIKDIDAQISELLEQKRKAQEKEKLAVERREKLIKARQVKQSAEYAKSRAEIKNLVRVSEATIKHICKLASRNKLTDLEEKVLVSIAKYNDDIKKRNEPKPVKKKAEPKAEDKDSENGEG